MAKPKLTLQQQYDKEIKRIEKLIKNAESIGFEWVQTPVPPKPKRITEASVQKLKKITPQNIYKTAVYNDPISKTQFTGEQGQTIIKYRQTIENDKILKNKTIETPSIPQTKKTPKPKRKQTPRPKEIKKDRTGTPANINKALAETVSATLGGVRTLLDQYSPPVHWPEQMYNERLNIVNNLIAQINQINIGAEMERVANRFKERGSDIIDLTMVILFDSDQLNVQYALNEILSLITGGALSMEQTEAINDIVEFSQGYEPI